MDDHHFKKKLRMDDCHLRYMGKIPEKTLLKFLQKQFGKFSQYDNKTIWKFLIKKNKNLLKNFC
jgi:hypothetical protein